MTTHENDDLVVSIPPDPVPLTAAAAALRLSIFKAIAEQVKQADKRTRDEIAAGILIEGDRKKATLPDGRPVGTVSFTEGSDTMDVVDEPALLEWVRANAPTEVETIRRFNTRFLSKVAELLPEAIEEHEIIREAYLTVLAGRVVDSVVGPIDTATGEPVPGVKIGRKAGYLTVRQSEAERATLVEAHRCGLVDLVEPITLRITAE